jgi:hypothetical protein
MASLNCSAVVGLLAFGGEYFVWCYNLKLTFEPRFSLKADASSEAGRKQGNIGNIEAWFPGCCGI